MMAQQAPASPYRILMLCMGNICRSPLAEGILKKKLADTGLQDWIELDSAGTHFYHVGNPPDPRSIRVADEHGYSIAEQRCRQLQPEDFKTYDELLVMDKRNMRDALALAPSEEEGQKLQLILNYAREPLSETEVPDPYHEGPDGFLHVLQLLEKACDGLIFSLQDRGKLPQQ